MTLFFVDEVQLIGREQRALVWQAPPQMNPSSQPLDAATGITMVAAFSVKGLVAYNLVVGSLKTAEYLAFLQKLRILTGQECIGLFYDGSNVHKSAAAQQKLQQYQWLRLLNVAHSQEDNPS